MVHSNNLNAIREFTIQQAIREWKNTATAHRSLKNKPPVRIPTNSLASLPNGLQKESANAWLFFIIKIQGFHQLQFGN